MRGPLVLALALIGGGGNAAAQSVPLVVESLTDFGRLADPPTAEVLAVGSMVTFDPGRAADAALNPAGLGRGPRGDVVVTMAGSRIARDVFTSTTTNPMGVSPHEQRTISGPWSAAGFLGAALRRPKWGVGAFYDASSRLRHRFSTGDRTISQISSPGGAVFQRVTGRTDSSAEVDVSRVGASAALAAFGRRLAIGGGVEATRLHLDIESVSELQSLSIVRPRPPAIARIVATGALKRDQWKGGVTVGAAWQPLTAFSMSVVRRWRPEFTAVLAAERRNLDSGFVEPFSQRLTIDGPDLFAIGATFTAAATKIGFEMVRVDYGALRNNSLLSPAGNVLHAPGVAVEPHVGARHGVSIGGVRQLVVSGGVWGEGVHALSTDRSDVFVPAPRRRTWVTGGVALEGEHVTFAAAAGRTRGERRVIVTFGLRQR